MEKSYTNSAYYHIRLTSRYIKAFITQVLEKLNADITPDEIFVLDILKKNDGICQRDLAKLLLKDRANTGKIASTLAQKGLINIAAEKKNKRLVKKLSLTKNGEELLESLWQKSKPIFDEISKHFTQNEDIMLQEMLKKLRKNIGNVLEMQI